MTAHLTPGKQNETQDQSFSLKINRDKKQSISITYKEKLQILT